MVAPLKKSLEVVCLGGRTGGHDMTDGPSIFPRLSAGLPEPAHPFPIPRGGPQHVKGCV